MPAATRTSEATRSPARWSRARTGAGATSTRSCSASCRSEPGSAARSAATDQVGHAALRPGGPAGPALRAVDGVEAAGVEAHPGVPAVVAHVAAGRPHRHDLATGDPV